ncbi:polysaccharide pyruvyl transferase family protein [Desulfoluna butyratoxydans]|uniref:Polysaccharide pyruvyl transferase n=1 Tax=Desulfoluna butyratoxydans TaxID=231438 RepID=A0A4U8YX07_9BACT|nr:polysaccharide pyruvyl transferase family protein [Desulfoluna butyratoxydans]VFQ46552.1 polysaccharide pyruvyl transferase [Desulfoluna butyratoxydans]
MKIFLDCLASSSCISIGTNAFIISDIELLNEKYPKCEIVLFSSDPEVDKLQFGYLPYKISYIQRSKSQIVAMLQIRRIVSQVDVVVSAWGDGYITVPPYKLLRKTIFLKRQGVPLILFTSSIGPFNGGFKDKLALLGLKKFDAITVRDQNTFEYLKPHGLNRLRLVHDTAFVLEPCSDYRRDELLRQSGLEGGEKFIGLNVSVLMYNLYKERGQDYISLMIEYIEWILNNFEIPIVLIPHQLYPKKMSYTIDEYQSKDGDDRFPIELILSKINKTDRLFALEQEVTPQEVKGVIGKSELFIGSRMHSVIAAISLSVPSLVMQYSHKSEGMMRFLRMPEYVWDINKDFEDLTRRTSALWRDRQIVRAKLNEIMPGIYEDIYDLCNEIERVLESKCA